MKCSWIGLFFLGTGLIGWMISSRIFLYITTESFFYHSTSWYDASTTALRRFPELTDFAIRYHDLKQKASLKLDLLTEPERQEYYSPNRPFSCLLNHGRQNLHTHHTFLINSTKQGGYGDGKQVPHTPIIELYRKGVYEGLAPHRGYGGTAGPTIVYYLSAYPQQYLVFFKYLLRHGNNCTQTLHLPALFQSHDCKFFQSHNVMFVHVPLPFTLEQLSYMANIIVLGEHYDLELLIPLVQAYKFQEQQWEYLNKIDRKYITFEKLNISSNIVSTHLHLTWIGLSDESCQNPEYNLLQSHGLLDDDSPLRLIYQTYDDCRLVDGSTGFLWPLGPSTENGFQLNFDDSQKQGEEEKEKRPIKLNLMASFHRDKPTRMQAWMAACQWCGDGGLTSHTLLTKTYKQGGYGETAGPPMDCYMEITDWWPRILRVMKKLGFVNDKLISFIERLVVGDGSSSSGKYEAVLKQSQFTLCPAGKNPDQYRIWEAIAAGSIPIIEMPHYETLVSVSSRYSHRPVSCLKLPLHPAYGLEWNCRQDSFHSLLKQTNAPVIFITNWEKDLPRILNQMTDLEILQLRIQLQQWWKQFQISLLDHLMGGPAVPPYPL